MRQKPVFGARTHGRVGRLQQGCVNSLNVTHQPSAGARLAVTTAGFGGAAIITASACGQPGRGAGGR